MVLAVSDLDKAAGIQQSLFLRHGRWLWFRNLGDS